MVSSQTWLGDALPDCRTKKQLTANNNLRGILRLHDELLAEISIQFAVLYTMVAQPHTFVLANSITHYAWIIISHISRRWRAVALNTPRLWATIALPYNIAWIKTLLQRSGQVPLTVIEDIADLTPERIAAKDLVLREKSRIQRLAIVVNPVTVSAIVAALADPSLGAPLLDALDIKLLYDMEWPAAPTVKFSRRPLSRLRHLSFGHGSNHMSSEWTSSSVSDLHIIQPFFGPPLTSLYLNRFETPVSSQTILDLLRTLPNLEVLVLGEVMKASSGHSNHNLRTSASDLVRLPRLQGIEFRGSCAWWTPIGDEGESTYDIGVGAATVLRHLVIPTSTEIFFSAGDNYFRGEPLDFICEVLADALAGRSITSIGPPQKQPVTKCCVTIGSPDDRDTFECEVELFRSESTRPSNFEHDPTNRDAHDRRRVDTESYLQPESKPLSALFRTNYYSFLQCVCQVLKSCAGSLSSVTTLHLLGHIEDPWRTDDTGYMDDLWRTIKETMPELRELRILGHSKEFARWLGDDIEDVRQPVFPTLQTLEIDGSEWEPLQAAGMQSDEESDSGEEEEGEEEDKTISGSLVETLQWWAGQFADERKLGRLIVGNADKVNQGDLEKIKNSGFVCSFEVV